MSKKIFTLIALGAALHAASQDTVKTKVLDPVVVTANKVEQKQSTTGKVVTVIDKEQLEKSSGKTVAQILNEQAGITVNGALQDMGSVQTVFMRGANAGRALILLDGIPMNDPSQINGDYDLNLFSINDVERIEICKGAQSTLYGSDAVAGVINIITVKKDINKPINVKATVGLGNKSTNRDNIQVYGKVAEKLTYTARFSKLRTTGFSAAFDSSGKKNFDNDGYNGDYVNASAQYQFTKAFSFKSYIQNSQYEAGADAGTFTDERNYTVNSKSLNTGAGFNFKKERFNIVGNYQYGKQSRAYDDNYSIPGATAYSLNAYNANTQYVELYSSIKLTKSFSALVGGDYRFASMNSNYKSLSIYGPYNSVFPDTTMNQKSAYASIYFNSKHFNVEVGGRYNSHSKYGSNSTFTFNPSYTINDHYRIFGSIASAFKAPSLYQLFAGVTPTGTNGPGNPNLQPEKSTNYEIGIEEQYGNFSNRLVYFYRSTNNGIDYQNLSVAPYGLYYNFINQVVKGLEYEVTLHPTKALGIIANYTYLSADEQTQSRVNTHDTAYSYVLRRPKNSINATVGYQFTPALYVSVSGKSVGSRYDVGGYHKDDVIMDAYFILNASAEYKLNTTVRFFANAQNIGNKKFYEIRGYNSIPFIINGGVTFNW